LTEVGTFGGPNSISATGPAYSYEKYFNGQGATVGAASTKIPDPFSPNCFYDCFADHALTFQNNTLTDLGAPGLASSLSYGINDTGLVVGLSENGLIDPLTGYPEYHAMAWINGVQGDLGTFGGSVSQAFMVNDRGEVVGVAANAVPDAYATALGSCTSLNCWPVTTQQRAFLWTGGALRDLGTLGGNDAVAYFVNAAGQVAGVSYTNTTPNPTTGAPTQIPFLWDQGKMVGLGSLGGTWGVTYSLNNRGQVVGNSNLAGDQYWHGFFWDQGVFTDLGTLGGDISYAAWLNDAGDVVGGSLLADDETEHAFLYTHTAMTDLGTVGADSFSLAVGINESRQIVGCSGTSGCSRAFLWEGGAVVDLNALVEPASNLQLLLAYAIADSGEILAYGTLPNGDVRLALLFPDGDCDGHCQSQVAASLNSTSAPQRLPLSPGMKWQPNLLGAAPPHSAPSM
jgi:probable HAF family extracellular repeat protein